MEVVGRLACSSLALVLLGGCALFAPLPPKTSAADRLESIPTEGLPVSAPVKIYWDANKVPFVEAAADRDAAFALGLVHAHLRLGQMELLRRISQGRIAEMGGPLAADIDHSLRVLDFGKASPAVLAAMPTETREWLDGFVAGINHYQAQVAELPHEFALLGLEREPWRAEEVITIGRLASTDVTWLVWFRLLALRDEPGFDRLWARVAATGQTSAPSFEMPAVAALGELEAILSRTARNGSNSLAIAGARSASGSALIANDPHLGLSLPNLWLIAGVKSPSYHMVGLMIPGLPFVAVGRNADIAWGGTNLRAASSDLFDVSALPETQFTTRRDTIGTRWWLDRDIEIRDTPYGPLISDAPLVPKRKGEKLALSWIGHRPSDEMSAMLAVNRARDWSAFRRALAGFALSPQNFVYADRAGNIGQVTAAHLPRRPDEPPAAIVRPINEARLWDDIVTSAELPSTFNPQGGFVASANNKPAGGDILIGYFFSADDRILRLQGLLSAPRKWTADDLKAVQMDTYRQSAVNLRDALMARIDRMVPPVEPTERNGAVLRAIASWDGDYRVDSRGAVAFESLMAALAENLYDATVLAAYGAGNLYEFLAEDLARFDDARITAALAVALPRAATSLERYPTWGDMHRLEIEHLLANIPVIGGRYRFGDLPAAGGNETVLKTAHDLTAERHATRYGAQARHVSDLADPDANWFVLLGGQDGWFNSANFSDQIELFQTGRLIQVPLSLDRVRSGAAYETTLRPAAPGS
jgi:penicillin amidase